jgi:acyl carrier protein
MERNQIIGQLKKILVDDLFIGDNADDISETNHLGTDLGLDSVGFVELATIVGETFSIEILDQDVGQGHFATLELIADFILTRQVGASAA